QSQRQQRVDGAVGYAVLEKEEQDGRIQADGVQYGVHAQALRIGDGEATDGPTLGEAARGSPPSDEPAGRFRSTASVGTRAPRRRKTRRPVHPRTPPALVILWSRITTML